MKKKGKILLSVIVSSYLVLGLSGCGTSPVNTKNNLTNSPTHQQRIIYQNQKKI